MPAPTIDSPSTKRAARSATNSKTRFIAPSLAILALRGDVDQHDHLDPDGDGHVIHGGIPGRSSVGGFLGLGLIGAPLGLMSRPVGIALSVVGVGTHDVLERARQGPGVRFSPTRRSSCSSRQGHRRADDPSHAVGARCDRDARDRRASRRQPIPRRDAPRRAARHGHERSRRTGHEPRSHGVHACSKTASGSRSRCFGATTCPCRSACSSTTAAACARCGPKVEAAALAFARASNPDDEVFVVNFADKVHSTCR